MRAPFPTLVGHAQAKQDLAACLAGGRLRGSFLLVGPEGVGRLRFARLLAQAANCLGQAPDPLPCGACGPCGRIARGTSGDFQILSVPEGKTKIPLEQVRALLDELALAPVECEVRAFLIEGAGDLMIESQNALLKALEEPPERALLLLTAERQDEVLPTILSRCRIVHLGELSPAELEQVLAAEGADELARRTAWGAGSPGQALSDEALAAALAVEELLKALVSGAAYRDPMAAVEELGGFVQPGKGESRTQRARLTRLLRLLQRALRDGLLTREGARGGRLSGAEPRVLEALARLPRGRLERALDALHQADEELDRNPNVKLLLDGLVLDLGAALTGSSGA